jgi:aminoglycoside phosphotransferase family enzyme
LPARHLCRQQWLFVASHGRQLAARGDRVVDGHGDLKPEHVWLGRPLQIIDCLEFDRSLRRCDPLEELALLTVEMERLGRKRSAVALLPGYQRRNAPLPGTLWQFYLSHRAATRAKLAAWHIGDPQYPDPRPWRRRARRDRAVAQAHIDKADAMADYMNRGVTGSPRSTRRRASANSGATGNSASL